MGEVIGANAGLIWTALSEGGKMSIKDLKRVTKLRKDKELYAAIGWLAREEKVALEEVGEEMFVELMA